MTLPRIPIDILIEIFGEIPRPDLLALCRVSKSFYHHASDFLYRDISTLNILGVCATLTQSPHLAARVQHFKVSRPSIRTFHSDNSKFALIGNALQCLSNLQSLSLEFFGQYSWMLVGCTFKIEKLVSFIVCDEQFVHFLNGQPELATIWLSCPCIGLRILPTCVPKLTKIRAQISWLAEIIPGRRVKEIIFEEDHLNPTIPLSTSFSPSSWSAVRILSIKYSSLRVQPLTQIAAFMPSLEDLRIEEPFMKVSLHDQDTRLLMEWLCKLLSVLPNLRRFTLSTINGSDVWSDEDEMEFLESVTKLASSMLKTFVLHYSFYPIVNTTWICVDGVWAVSHRERQESRKMLMLKVEREVRKQKWMAELAAHYETLRSSSARASA